MTVVDLNIFGGDFGLVERNEVEDILLAVDGVTVSTDVVLKDSVTGLVSLEMVNELDTGLVNLVVSTLGDDGLVTGRAVWENFIAVDLDVAGVYVVIDGLFVTFG